MENEDVKIICLTVKQILLYLTDGAVRGQEIFDSYNYYSKPIKAYFRWRNLNKEKFSQSIYRLKKAKFIKLTLKDNSEYLELTPKGKRKIKSYLIQDLKIKNQNTWDKKWRIVIFDIPNSKKAARDALASTLKRLGFRRLQKSVFIYPFPCKQEIDFLKASYNIGHHLQYIIANRIDTEKNLLGYFYDNKVLNKHNTLYKNVNANVNVEN